MRLRDHDKRCTHGHMLAHSMVVCPGGSDVVVDWEAAIIEGAENGVDELAVRAIVAVALGTGLDNDE